MFSFTVLRMEQAKLASQTISLVPAQQVEHDANLPSIVDRGSMGAFSFTAVGTTRVTVCAYVDACMKGLLRYVHDKQLDQNDTLEVAALAISFNILLLLLANMPLWHQSLCACWMGTTKMPLAVSYTHLTLPTKLEV